MSRMTTNGRVYARRAVKNAQIEGKPYPINQDRKIKLNRGQCMEMVKRVCTITVYKPNPNRNQGKTEGYIVGATRTSKYAYRKGLEILLNKHTQKSENRQN